jgi:molybdate transport system ATP-binding protein
MRKTLLIKAILSDPAVLILDSPLDGLDRASQAEMRNIITELLQSAVSIVMLCRNLEDIPDGISHVLVLDNGKVSACGTQEQVLAKPSVVALMDPPAADLGELPTPADRPYDLVPGQALLQLRNVAVSYGDTKVLQGVNWTLEEGMHCCISGPNGCGKTTLLSLITGDNHKAYGQDITLFGVRRGSGESIWDIKQKYGQLDTQLHLNFARGMRVIEVVVSGFFDSIGLYDDWGDTQRDRAMQWLLALGLSQHSSEGFDGLSFGMQRMALLARAMVKSPIILLLDEPTLGLDAHHRRLMLRAIDHIAQNCDTQVIFVSHSIGDTPGCINQFLTFEPSAEGFELVCS